MEIIQTLKLRLTDPLLFSVLKEEEMLSYDCTAGRSNFLDSNVNLCFSLSFCGEAFTTLLLSRKVKIALSSLSPHKQIFE